MTTIGTKFILSFSLLLAGLVFCATGFGAEVVMKSGERFKTSQVWEQDGKIRFNMNGLIVDVVKDDVADIIQGRGTPASRSHSRQPFKEKTPGLNTNPRTEELVGNSPNTAANAAKNHVLSKLPGPVVQNRSLTAANHNTGFQGIYWQMRPEEIPGLEKVETDPAFGGIDQYWRPSQSLQWGRAALDGWVYGFWRGQLYSIMMWINGWPGYVKLHQQAVALFGAGSQNNANEERYVWVDPANHRMLEYDHQLGMGILTMRSSSVDAQIKKLYPNP